MFRKHFAGFKCFNVHTRMTQYRSRIRHSWTKGECITELRQVLHHPSGHIKTRKAAKCVPSVLSQLDDLSANQMCGTQMNFVAVD